MLQRLLPLALASLTLPALGQTVTLEAVKDNTLHEDAGGLLSNGAGDAIRAGRNSNGGGALIRRATLAFDLSGIPQGATITSASLQLTVKGSGSTNAFTNSLHRLTKDWGEGTSNGGGGGAASTTNDATWIHTFYPGSFWTNPGGDFEAVASASLSVAGAAVYTWSSAAMIDDVQGWLDSPSTNFGWILVGDESVQQTAKRYASREDAVPADRPQLIVSFTPPCNTTAAVSFRTLGSNASSYSATPAVVGSGFTANVDNNVAGQFQSMLFGFETKAAIPLTGGQVLLCMDSGSGELFSGVGLSPTSSAGGVDQYTLAVPGNTALCGNVIYTQAIQFGAPPFVLSNAQDLTLGN